MGVSDRRIEQIKQENKARQERGEAPKVYNLINQPPAGVHPKGNKTGICANCGKEFEQDYSSDRNAYSNFKTCHACRWELAEQMKKERQQDGGKEFERTVATLSYTPYPWQQQAHEDFATHRFQVIAAGARAGKDRYSTMAGIRYFAECLNENRFIERPDMVPAVYWWLICPIEKIGKQIWNELKQFFPKEWIVAVSDSTYSMETIGGGLIELRSAYDPEDLVGVGLDLVTMTEAARVKDLETTWGNLEDRLNSPGRGLASEGMGGKAIINSSPRGKNYFYKMWCWGQKSHPNYTSDWISYQIPTDASPAMAERYAKIVRDKNGEEITYKEALHRRKGRKFEQDNLASFLAQDGTVFRTFDDKCVERPYYDHTKTHQELKDFYASWREVAPYRRYRIGYDPATGSSQDSPCIVVRDMETNRIVIQLDMYGKNYDAQYAMIAEISRKYNSAECVMLITGHTACEGQLAKRGVLEIAITEQGSNKQKYVQALEFAVQNEDVHVLDDASPDAETLIFQMNDYTQDGNKFSNLDEEHDDFVSAMYAAYYDYQMESLEEHLPYYGRMGGSKREGNNKLYAV